MASFTDSLTIRLLADNSQLSRVLDATAAQLAQLEARMARLSDARMSFVRSGRLDEAFRRPLTEAIGLLDGIARRVGELSRTPITLNVRPAIASLAFLDRTIALVAARLRLLSAIPAAAPSAAIGLATGTPVRSFVGGGLVTGPAGIDRVPAMLTAGEFVLQPGVVDRLGVGVLEALNRSLRNALPGAPSLAQVSGASTGIRGSRMRGEAGSGSTPASITTNHFGGVTIQVTRTADIDTILRDLAFHGFRLRNRRG